MAEKGWRMHMSMKFKIVLNALLFAGMFASVANAIDVPGTGTQVGGHVKIIAADPMWGTWTDTGSIAHKGYQNGGFSIARAFLMISQEIGSFCSIEMMPEFSAEAGATPKLGQKIDNMVPANLIPNFDGWQKLFIKFALPKQVELSLGYMNSRFTYEYSSETWWEEEFHVNKPTHDLGIMQEKGIEIYKNFNVGKLSLPLYVYVLTGGNNQLDEPNKTPLYAIHVEPEIGAFKFSGSLAYEKWDAHDSLDEIRWSAGAAYELQNFSIRGEAMGGNWKGKIITDTVPTDAKGIGFYIKPLYRFADWCKVGIDFSYVDEKISDDGSEDKDLNIDPLLIFTPVAGISVISQNDIGIWSGHANKDQKLGYFRSTLGVRCTF
jgi:hypothetical protein